MVNLLNATSFAYKQFILCYVNFTSVINQWRAEPPEGWTLTPQGDAAVLGSPGVLLLPKLLRGGFITASPPTHQARNASQALIAHTGFQESLGKCRSFLEN